MADDPYLSVVSPVYGCEGCIEELCARVQVALASIGGRHEIILVCDGSPDDSWQRIAELAARDPRIVGIRLTRNFGQHFAISAGLEHARGEWIVVMDCDLQDRPDAIPALHSKAREGYDIVFAQRIERQDSWAKRLFSWAFFRVLSYMTGTFCDPRTANFGIFSARAIAMVNSMPERSRCFPLMVRWAGYPATSIPVAHAPRASGRSSYRFGALLRMAVDIILSWSDKPLRLLARVGLLFSIAAFVLVAVSVYRYFRGEIAVAGYTSIIAAIWLVGGVLMSGLGVTGLYVGRVFNDIKRRPYYAIDECLNLHAGSHAQRNDA